MKKGLNRGTLLFGNNMFATSQLNVWDTETKQIVFTGTLRQVSTFIGRTEGAVRAALVNKSKCKKKYAIRFASTK